MMNDPARTTLDPATRRRCWGTPPRRWPAPGRPAEVQLPTGATARMTAAPAVTGQLGRRRRAGEDRAAGATPGRRPRRPRRRDAAARAGRRRAAVAAGLRRGRAGVPVRRVARGRGRARLGKAALLRAVHQRRQPAAGSPCWTRPRRATPAGWRALRRTVLRRGGGSVVLRHVDTLDGTRAAGAWRRSCRRRPGCATRPWVAVTVDTARRPARGARS